MDRPSRTKSKGESSNKDCRIRKKRAAKRKPLRERRQPRKRVVHGEENKKERAKCCRL